MIFFEFIVKILRDKQVYKYLPVSVGALCSLLSLTWFFSSIIGIYHPFSVAISFEIGIIWTFFVLDKWTFKEGAKKNIIVKRFLQYHLVAISGLVVNEAIFLFFTYVVNWYYLLAELLASLFTFGYNFILNKKVSWASHKESTEKK